MRRSVKGKKKKNKFGSSSENEDSDEDSNAPSQPEKKSSPPLPQIMPTTSIVTKSELQSPPNPLEDALKETEKKSSFKASGSQNLNNRVNQALKVITYFLCFK